MRLILDKLVDTFGVVIFGDHVILEEPIKEWPICDILIGFYSDGFPLEKAMDYVKLRQPFCVNDLPLQQLLLDRRLILMILDAIDVPTPPRLTCNRRGDQPMLPADLMDLVSRDFNIDFSNPAALFPEQQGLLLPDGSMQVGQQRMLLPWVEKPVDAEDHNIHVHLVDGSVRHLFRKVANVSSEVIPSSTIRTDRSYLYEQFMETNQCEDVKVYTIGPYYAYAETRK